MQSAGSPDEADGWKAHDTPDTEHDDLAHWTSGLGDLGVGDTEIDAAVALLRDPPGSEPERIRRTLLDLGSSPADSEAAIRGLEAIKRRPGVTPGAPHDWGAGA